MELIVISSPKSVSGEVDLVSGMLKAGLQTFHLRKPGASVQTCESFLRNFNAAERKKFVIHSKHELVPQWGLKVSSMSDNKEYCSTPESKWHVQKDLIKQYEATACQSKELSMSRSGSVWRMNIHDPA